HLFYFEDFNLIADLNIVVLHADTTLHAVAHFVDIVFKATQRFQLALEDHHIVAQYADRFAAMHRTLHHHTTGHLTKLGRVKYFAHVGDTQDCFDTLRIKHTAQRRFHFVKQLVNDAVVANVHTFGLRYSASCGIGAYIKANNNRAGCERQVDIIFSDTTNTGRHHIHLNFL